jgi:hypothetical protein
MSLSETLLPECLRHTRDHCTLPQNYSRTHRLVAMCIGMCGQWNSDDARGNINNTQWNIVDTQWDTDSAHAMALHQCTFIGDKGSNDVSIS